MTEATPPPVMAPERRRNPTHWSPNRTHDLTASTMALGALIVVGILALRGSEAALGALIGILSAATGFLMRGRVEPTNGG